MKQHIFECVCVVSSVKNGTDRSFLWDLPVPPRYSRIRWWDFFFSGNNNFLFCFGWCQPDFSRFSDHILRPIQSAPRCESGSTRLVSNLTKDNFFCLVLLWKGTGYFRDSKPDVSSNTIAALRQGCENQVGRGLWIVTLNESQCQFGWESLGQRCVGARACTQSWCIGPKSVVTVDFFKLNLA